LAISLAFVTPVAALRLRVGRWYLATVALEGFLLDLDDEVQPVAWVAKGDLVVAAPTGGMAFLGGAAAPGVRGHGPPAASVLHGQISDHWRLLEFGLPHNALDTAI
jgi:hypothetical protein